MTPSHGDGPSTIELMEDAEYGARHAICVVPSQPTRPRGGGAPRVVADHIMLPEDFERLHKFLLETEDLSEVSDDIRELVEEEWPELVHKLPPKAA